MSSFNTQYDNITVSRTKAWILKEHVTFPHDPGELPSYVLLWDGCGRGISITGRWVWGLEGLGGRVFICSWLCRFWRGGGGRLLTGARVWGGLSRAGGAVGFDGCDDDLLELLKGVSQVPPFQNILTAKDNKRVWEVPWGWFRGPIEPGLYDLCSS